MYQLCAALQTNTYYLLNAPQASSTYANQQVCLAGSYMHVSESYVTKQKSALWQCSYEG